MNGSKVTSTAVGVQSRIDQQCHGSLIPERETRPVVVVHEFGIRILDFVDFVEELLARDHLIGDVPSNDDVWKVGGQRDLGRFRVDHKVNVRIDISLVDRTNGLEYKV